MASGESMQCSRYGLMGMMVSISFLALVMPCQAYAEIEIGSAVQEGVVVDAASGLPIEGAFVVGRWSGTYATNIADNAGERCVHQAVVRADGSGRFVIPAWRQSGTPLDEIGMMIHVYKPGYEQASSAVAYRKPPYLQRMIGAGTLELPTNRFRIQMKAFSGNASARAEYLLGFMPRVGCTRIPARWGEIYYVYQAVLDEISTFPPDVQRSKAGVTDVIGHVQRWTNDARDELARESGSKDQSK